MTERDLMRLFAEYDGEVSMSDFSPEELAEMLAYKAEECEELKRKYFELDSEEERKAVKVSF